MFCRLRRALPPSPSFHSCRVSPRLRASPPPHVGRRYCRSAAPQCLAGASVAVAGDRWLPKNTTVVAVEGGRSRAAVLAARRSLLATRNTTGDAVTWLSHFFLVAPSSGSRGGRKSHWVLPHLASAASVTRNSHRVLYFGLWFCACIFVLGVCSCLVLSFQI